MHDIVVYTYRTAMVYGVFLTLPRELTAAIEKFLAKSCGVSTDNHTCYTFTDGMGRKIAVRFSDSETHFGTTLKEGSW